MKPKLKNLPVLFWSASVRIRIRIRNIGKIMINFFHGFILRAQTTSGRAWCLAYPPARRPSLYRMLWAYSSKAFSRVAWAVFLKVAAPLWAPRSGLGSATPLCSASSSWDSSGSRRIPRWLFHRYIIYLSICTFIYLSYLSSCLSIYVSIYLSIYLPPRWASLYFVCLSIVQSCQLCKHI